MRSLYYSCLYWRVELAFLLALIAATAIVEGV